MEHNANTKIKGSLTPPSVPMVALWKYEGEIWGTPVLGFILEVDSDGEVCLKGVAFIVDHTNKDDTKVYALDYEYCEDDSNFQGYMLANEYNEAAVNGRLE